MSNILQFPVKKREKTQIGIIGLSEFTNAFVELYKEGKIEIPSLMAISLAMLLIETSSGIGYDDTKSEKETILQFLESLNTYAPLKENRSRFENQPKLFLQELILSGYNFYPEHMEKVVALYESDFFLDSRILLEFGIRESISDCMTEDCTIIPMLDDIMSKMLERERE